MSARKKRLLLVGGNGMLARSVVSSAPSHYVITAVDLPEFDITDQEQVMAFIEELQPAIIVNCAAYTNVDGCESEQVLANKVNGDAVGYLARAAHKVDAVLVHVSTDYVFDGEKKIPYVEDDLQNPQSAYGRSKLRGEEALLSSGLEKFFIVRTSWLYGSGGSNFVETILRLAKEREELRVINDQLGTPTYTRDLAEAIFNLLELNPSPHPTAPSPYGIYHFSNEGQCSWYEFACAIVEKARKYKQPVKSLEIHPIATTEYPLPARRPAYSVFDKSKYKIAAGATISHWLGSLETYFSERAQNQ